MGRGLPPRARGLGTPSHTYSKDGLQSVGVDALAQRLAPLPLRNTRSSRRAGVIAHSALALIGIGFVPLGSVCEEDGALAARAERV
jgi:hypothetical protein